MIRLVILPGLDGTASLHAGFVAALGDTFSRVDVIAYPSDQSLDYGALEAKVRTALPRSEPFVLLGESFSGSIAISIAANPPANLRGVVLSTTFARTPVPFSRALAPFVRFAPVRRAPMPVMSWWLLGRWSSPKLEAALRQALEAVSADVLRHRAGIAMRADVSNLLEKIHLPVVYLSARGDRLVPAKAGRLIKAGIRNCTVIDVQGPHLLLQAAASACAEVIRREVDRLGWRG